MPPGRRIGNSTGQLGQGWGEVRGTNGVIIAAPSVHLDADQGGRYEWQTTGRVPELPAELAAMLTDAGDVIDAASDTDVTAYRLTYTRNDKPGLLDVLCRKFLASTGAGASRHETAVDVTTHALKEAQAGFYPAETAVERLGTLFRDSVADDAGRPVESEWRGIVAYAVGCALADDPHARRIETEKRLSVAATPLPEIQPLRAGSPLSTVVTPSSPRRTVRLTPANVIDPRPVRWLWDGRLAVGTLGLIAGREGIGKSTVAYQLIADVTRGRMPGIYYGQPKAVIVAATEDSWSHTIIPRLMAADADRSLVYRIDVEIDGDIHAPLSLPHDNIELEHVIRETGAALILLDPLMSRLDASLDTHKDAEVRRALEPLVRMAEQADAAVLGLIHVNKSTSKDPLTLIMGSRAFSAVARSVLFAMRDPDDDNVILLGQEKNNLGRSDLPTLAFTIVNICVAVTSEGPVNTGKVQWLGESSLSIKDALNTVTEQTPETKTATQEAMDWLHDYLMLKGGAEKSSAVKRAAQAEGHATTTLNRAKNKLGVIAEMSGFPRTSWWRLPEPIESTGGVQSNHAPGES